MDKTKDLTAIDAHTLKDWIDRESVCLIDVREAGEYAGAHILGAIELPLSQLKAGSFKLPSDRRLALYCRSGHRSQQAAQILATKGYTDLYHLEGGIGAWQSAGYQTQSIANAPISLFRQIQIVAGSLVVLGTILGAMVSPLWLLLSGFVGSGLVFAGISNTCAMGMLLAKLPYNRS
jgi:rhodanese-related sulfurtransferase